MKRYIILIILLIILGVGLFIGLNLINDEETTVKKIFTKEGFNEYKSGDLVKLNGDEWYVMYDSNKDSDYVTLISADILSLDEMEIDTVLKGIYETSDLNKYLKDEYAKSIGEDKLVEKNGYKVRLFDKDDFNFLINEEDYSYDEERDEYVLTECPEFICLTNTFYATMIDTRNDVEFFDVYYNVADIEDLLYGDYTLHLKYYNITATYETYKINSLVDNATLFVRPVINVYKNSLDK